MIPARICPLLMTQPAIQVVMILEATLHRIVEGLTIKSVEILRNRSIQPPSPDSKTSNNAIFVICVTEAVVHVCLYKSKIVRKRVRKTINGERIKYNHFIFMT